MLKTRILTALILAPIAVIGIFFLPPLGFAVFTGVAITLGAWEWANMAGYTSGPARAGYGALVALILVAVAAVVMAAATHSRDATFDKITAKKLFIVNDAGKVQATLGVGENGGGLSINNKTGERVVQLKAD